MKGVQFSMEGIRKGYLSCQKWYIKGLGFGTRGRASPYKPLLSTFVEGGGGGGPLPQPGQRAKAERLNHSIGDQVVLDRLSPQKHCRDFLFSFLRKIVFQFRQKIDIRGPFTMTSDITRVTSR